MELKKPTKKELEAFKKKARSKFEQRVGQDLFDKEIPIDYENIKIKYIQPEKERTYTPDLLLPNGIIIEAKGRLTVKARKKHKWIRDTHPQLDIRFVFQRPQNKIYKGSKTSYSDWCERHGFKWAEKRVPMDWIEEEGPTLEFTEKIIRKAGT